MFPLLYKAIFRLQLKSFFGIQFAMFLKYEISFNYLLIIFYMVKFVLPIPVAVRSKV